MSPTKSNTAETAVKKELTETANNADQAKAEIYLVYFKL